MRAYIQSEYVELGNREVMTVTQQFNIVNNLTLGYNSYWYDQYPPLCHSLFLDLDHTKLFVVKEILHTVRMILANELRLGGNKIGVILQSSETNHHVVIPHMFRWSQVLYILSEIAFVYDKPQLFDWIKQCVTRGYCTLRLSPKNGNSIKPLTVIKITDLDTDRFSAANPEHFNILMGLAKRHNKVIRRKLEQFKMVIPMARDVTKQSVTHYATRTPKEL